MSGDDLSRLCERIDALSQAVSRFGEAVHLGAAAEAQAAERAPAGNKPGAAGGLDDVIDAEFEEVDGTQKRQGG
jgi:molecular chaperone DnaK